MDEPLWLIAEPLWLIAQPLWLIAETLVHHSRTLAAHSRSIVVYSRTLVSHSRPLVAHSSTLVFVFVFLFDFSFSHLAEHCSMRLRAFYSISATLGINQHGLFRQGLQAARLYPLHSNKPTSAIAGKGCRTRGCVHCTLLLGCLLKMRRLRFELEW